MIENNEGPALRSVGGSATIGAYLTESVIRGNQGGLYLDEGSQAALFGHVLVRENGPYGAHVESGSHLTVTGILYEMLTGGHGIFIEGHTEVGVNVAWNSQVTFNGYNSLRANGSPENPSSAAIRVDGNSQVFIGPDTFYTSPKQTEIVDNLGAGIAVDMNSSIEVRDATIAGNSGEGVRVLKMSAARLGDASELLNNGGGALACDKSSFVFTNLAKKSARCRNVEAP